MTIKRPGGERRAVSARRGLHRCLATGLSVLAVFAGISRASPSDHAAAMGLVRDADVTHRAVRSGAWSSASTWGGAGVPGDGARVLVPMGTTVTFDAARSARVETVRVDGRLAFDDSRSTELRVDTLVVNHHGRLEIGTPEAPIGPDRTATLTFIDDGPISKSEDPRLIGRGLIAMGALSIAGAWKTPYVRLAADARRGQSTIRLEGSPEGWRVGDELLVVGTTPPSWVWQGDGQPRKWSGTKDDLRRIASIRSVGGGVTEITLDRALDHDHAAPLHSSDADPRPHVANLTRSVVIRSEGGFDAPTARRGHVMLMHPDARIDNAEFVGLGRTDKSRPIDDPGTNFDGSPGGGTNPRGRYAVHMHMIGAGDIRSDPVEVRGAVVRGSPGWGVVVHDSHGVVEDCVSYAVYGSHFATEVGTEIGAFRRNLAVSAQGRENGHVKDGTENHDLGQKGHGFWLQGRNFIVEDCVAAGTTDAAFIWFHRSDVFHPRIAAGNLLEPADYMHGRPDLPFEEAPIRGVRRLVAYAAGTGLHVMKATPHQHHDMRNTFEDFLFWNVHNGIHVEYTGHYTFRRLVLVGLDPNSQWRTGLQFGSRVKDQVVEDAHVENFGIGASFNDVFEGKPDRPDALLVNVRFVNVNTARFKNRDASLQVVMDRVPPNRGSLAFERDPSQKLTLPAALSWEDSGSFILRGWKNDSTGRWPLHAHPWKGDELVKILRGGHYTRPDGTAYIRLRQLVADRLTGEMIHVDLDVDLATQAQRSLGPDLGPAPAPRSAPRGAADTLDAPAGAPLEVPAPGLLANDDAEGAWVLPGVVGGPAHGTLHLNANGSFRYVPRPGFTGEDRFTYRLTDGARRSEPITVTLRVGAPEGGAGGCAADFNGDGAANVLDLLDFMGSFRARTPDADLDGNGAVDVQDLLSGLAAFRGGC